MTAKKQIDQESLRRMMRQKKEELIKKIDHPHAKYNSVGQLYCVLCQTHIKSNALWKAHLLSRSHKQNVDRSAAPPTAPKRSADTPGPGAGPPGAKIARAATSGTPAASSGLPLGDYSSSEEEEEPRPAPKGPQRVPGLKLPPRRPPPAEKTKEDNEEDKEEEKKMSDRIPEGFFDDPVRDAVVREVPYKSKLDEELESFQKAMKEMTQQSEAMIDADDEQMDAERSLSTIDDLMDRWQRVHQLELRREEIARPGPAPAAPEPKLRPPAPAAPAPAPAVKKEEEEEQEDSDLDPDDAALLWRSKRTL